MRSANRSIASSCAPASSIGGAVSCPGSAVPLDCVAGDSGARPDDPAVVSADATADAGARVCAGSGGATGTGMGADTRSCAAVGGAIDAGLAAGATLSLCASAGAAAGVDIVAGMLAAGVLRRAGPSRNHHNTTEARAAAAAMASTICSILRVFFIAMIFLSTKVNACVALSEPSIDSHTRGSRARVQCPDGASACVFPANHSSELPACASSLF